MGRNKEVAAWSGIRLFKDRVLFNTTFSRNRSSNQLLPYSLPIVTGFGSITSNFPATVQNTSWEFSVTSSNVNTRNLNWTTNLNPNHSPETR